MKVFPGARSWIVLVIVLGFVCCHVSAETIARTQQDSSKLKFGPKGIYAAEKYQRSSSSFGDGSHLMSTPLDEYVSRPDIEYEWRELEDVHVSDVYSVYYLNLTSQKWLDETLVSRPVWSHIVCVIVPNVVEQNSKFALYIGGGKDNSGIPSVEKDEELLVASLIATESKSIMVVIKQIPNQGIAFFDGPQPTGTKTEDNLIAYTWNHFHSHPDQPEWLLRLPMVKSVIRAMTAVEDYLTQKFEDIDFQNNNGHAEWVLFGASKRGWVTWLATAYDQAHEQRVIGMVPMVMSFVNMNECFHKWYQCLGNWSFALEPYYKLNFTTQFDDTETAKMISVIDPYSYFDRYDNVTMMEVMSSGDEFFQLQDPSNYWSALKNEKSLLIVENAEHSLITGLLTLEPALTGFFKTFLNEDIPRPKVSWDIDSKTGRITASTSVVPQKVNVWHSRTLQSERRDFRLVTALDPCPFIEVEGYCTQPIIWTECEAEKIDDTHYSALKEQPMQGGWRAFFIQFHFNHNVIFTTEASIVPNTFPFADCHGAGCRGYLT